MAHVLAIALPKGGVGKTTTAVNLAASLAISGKRTLLVDLDSVGSSGLSLGFTDLNARAGIYEVFNCLAGIRETIHGTELKNLDLIPAHVGTPQMEERLTRIADNRSILRSALRAVANDYDYVILDCPPILRGLTTNALAAANGVIMTVKCGNFSLDAVDKLFKYVEWIRSLTRTNLEIEGILLTMVEPNTRVTELTARHLQSRYGKYLFDTVIPQNSTLSEASFYGKPAVLYGVNSKGSAAYVSLAKEILSRQEARELAGRTNWPSALKLLDEQGG